MSCSLPRTTSLAAGGSAPDAASGSASVAAGDSTSPAAGNLAFTDADFRRIAAMPPAIAIDVSSAGERRKVPSGFDQAVPGIMVMFVLLVLLTTGGVLLVTERQEGLLLRLASSQVSKGEIVLSKLLARICLGMVQAGFAMLVGTLLFRIDWGGEVPGILLLLLAYGVSTSALSILFGNLARTRGQAVGFGVLGAILMAALGGCWWPIEVVPSFLQKIAWGLPTGWTMYALHRMMSFGEGFSAAVPALLLLASSAVVFFILAARTFRYQ
jgi:ABC-2 type transport system permease protein